MMNNKIKNKVVGLVAALVGSMSIGSCDYLDINEYLYDMTNLDSVFARKDLLTQYIAGAADKLPDESKMFTSAYAPYGFTTDECFPSWNDDRHAGVKYMRDEIDRFSGFFNNWPTYYKGIRKANLILERLNECQDITELDRRDYAGKAYFLRGYFYFLLAQQYGPVVIVPEKAYATDAEIESMTIERSTYDECMEYVCECMEKAYVYLNDTRESEDVWGQPTKGAALAVMSRARLYQASPWYNGNLFYNDWTRTDGTHFISQTPDAAKWGKAAAAAKRVIEMGKYELHTASKGIDTPELPSNISTADFPNGAGNIDPYHSYADMFTGEVPAINNPEFIWCRAENKDLQWIVFPLSMGGGNGLNVTQQLVDTYRMKDGRDINESSAEYPYPNSEQAGDQIGAGQKFSGYELRGTTAKMYDNREPRFYVTIGFNHAFWPGTSYAGTENNYKNLELTYYKDGTGAANSDLPDDKNWSGYTCKKYIHEQDNWRASGLIRKKYFPMFRYAEILLNYVEAMNEMEVPYTDPDRNIAVSRNPAEMVKYFNMIRYRAGLPGVTEADFENKKTARELIKRERQVEFALEGKRSHDIRRWGDAMTVLNEPFIGMNVDGKKNERKKFHTRSMITFHTAQHEFLYKMYFYPIKQSILDKNTKLVQNPGW